MLTLMNVRNGNWDGFIAAYKAQLLSERLSSAQIEQAIEQMSLAWGR